MNAYEIPNLRFSLPAGEDIARRRFVSVNSSSEGVIATTAGSAIGVSMNEAADGEVLDIADGIVVVEAGGAITAGSDVEVGANGKAVAKTTGIGVGVAITGATAAGQLVAVKLVSVSNANGTNGTDGAATQTIIYTAADLDAGVDLADIPIGAVVGAGTITAVTIISLGAADGVDEANESAFVLKVGTTTKATETFNADTTFPASGAAAALTVAEDASVAAGDVLLLNVTNGDTVNLPSFMVQVVVTLD
ncbi:MAG: DUF2190 family protein [Spirochaetales bacterium]|nr:DUF2190 family protein [Spirochaetales bacterium]